MSIENLGFARLDLSREERCGFVEVVYGPGKEVADLVKICTVLHEKHGRFLATRLNAEQGAALVAAFPDAHHNTRGRSVAVRGELSSKAPAIGVVTAGTADLPVAEEAIESLRFFGLAPVPFFDVGVAGLDRLLGVREQIAACDALIVIAGMEAALSSVIGGLVRVPIVAVPTSVGYGANFEGLTALLGMLNSCASGMTVVNIDNGFGAACAMQRIFGSRTVAHK